MDILKAYIFKIRANISHCDVSPPSDSFKFAARPVQPLKEHVLLLNNVISILVVG